MEKNDYYVYVFIREDNKSIYYVGEGNGNRIDMPFRNYECEYIESKYPTRREIHKSGLTKEEALREESRLIVNLVNKHAYGLNADGFRTSLWHYLCNGNFGFREKLFWSRKEKKELIKFRKDLYPNMFDRYPTPGDNRIYLQKPTSTEKAKTVQCNVIYDDSSDEFTASKQILFGSNLNVNEKLVYLAIQSGVESASYKNFSNLLNISLSSVKSSLKSLEEKGMIIKTNVRREDGGYGINTYAVIEMKKKNAV